MIREAIRQTTAGTSLDYVTARSVMGEVMDGVATPAQIAALLVALRMKGETAEEIAGFASVMRERCVRIRAPDGAVVDLCGTGGAPVTTFNVSTIASFVVAGAGATVAKHGNRSFTSRCGSADLLEALGVRIDLEPAECERILHEVGLTFLFAPKFHPAMRHAAGPRKEIGVRTVFNLLGPLTNPAGATAQVLGVPEEKFLGPIAEALRTLGARHALVVYGVCGMDEISVSCPTRVAEVRDGTIRRYVVTPRELGFPVAKPEDLAGSDPPEAAATAVRILRGAAGPKRDMVVANAAAGLRVADRVDTFADGVALALEALDSGRAYGKLQALVRATGGDAAKLEAIHGLPATAR